mmetsp:Transcript_46965/g.147670  ORF Transcript_46965/g.147670 Transcript_46965/m.147670 type:complete len:318 (+) Transcript_46965:77-1030(+)
MRRQILGHLSLLSLALAANGEAATTLSSSSSPPPPPWDPAAASSDRGRRAFAGLLAGTLSSVLFQPFDVVNTRMQVAPAAARAGMLHTASAVWREGGAAALWAGTVPSAVRLAGGIMLYFVFLGEAERAARAAFGELRGAAKGALDFALGGGSRTAAAFIFCPITVLKTRAELGGGGGGGLLAQLASLARREGAAGLWAGIGPSLARDVPYSAMSLLLLRYLQQRLRALGGIPEVVAAAAAGAAAATCATVATQPADVLRTHLVMAPQDKRLAALPALSTLLRQRGAGALFVGSKTRVCRRMLMQALSWGIFQAVVG